MKAIKILVLSIIILGLYSCDPNSCVDYLIENKLNSNIILRSHDQSNFIDQEINSRSFKNQLSRCDIGSSPTILEITSDSIHLIVDNIVKKTYYPDSPGKNIFNTQDQDSWRISESKKYYRKFVFEITEEDLN
ncbi:hypothetical protein ACFOUP_10080 [Belliella kenyensis]|uniref:Lipoprotein n=1 Tax=Belliella kenyensis TaxID=1472724 RepID=A0ABV8EK86_9BACT|nr:hypothetical protein [Belliella kenyensis]MCH7403288.1 hypothetical protein [Belliella kenyensis]MDN3602929.1 hypothetical protein [Belliella kenyensis]